MEGKAHSQLWVVPLESEKKNKQYKMLIRKRCVNWKSREFEKIKKEKEQEMIYLCCIRLFLLVTDFSSSKTEQLFSSRLSNFSVSSDIQYLRCYSHPQLKSNIYDEAVHHKYTKAPKGSFRSQVPVVKNLDSIIQRKRQHLYWIRTTKYHGQ